MKKYLTIVAIVLIGFASALADQPATQPSGTVKAFRKVRIEAPNVYSNLVAQFEKDNVADGGGLLNYVKGGSDYIDITKSADNDTPLLLISVQVQMDANGTPLSTANAAETADMVVDELRSRLAAAVQQRRAEWQSAMATAHDQTERLEQERIATEGRLKLIDGDIADIMAQTGLPDVSPEILQQLLQTLETQYETAQIDIAGKTARRDALAEAVAKFSNQQQQNLEADDVVQQLQKAVDARQSQLEQETKLHQVGQASQSDVDNAVAVLAATKAQLVQRESEIIKGPGDTLREWNQELLTLSVDLAELNARSKALDKQLKVLSSAQQELEQRLSREAVEHQLDKITDTLQSVQAQTTGNGLDADRPKLVVVESRDEAWKH